MKIERDEVTFQSQITPLQGIRKHIASLKTTDTTPNVSFLDLILTSGAVVTITNFIGGVDGQWLRILGDGTTVIKNNTHIVTNTGADKTLTINKVYRFTWIDTLQKWYEDA